MADKILIADDILANRLICRDNLRKEFPEFEYELFESGDSLVKRLNEPMEGVDLAIVDYDMPPGPKGDEIGVEARRQGDQDAPGWSGRIRRHHGVIQVNEYGAF